MKISKPIVLLISVISFINTGCGQKNISADKLSFIYGGDFSILKKMEDSGGVYNYQGKKVNALLLFKENGYNYGRVRIFHTPDMDGATCNSLEYTIALSKEIKAVGMKLLLDFHYSDTWADPAHQIKPSAWNNLTFEALTDSVFQYSKNVILAMKAANVLPDMVQVGNEITPGFIWPDGKIYKEGTEDWKSFTTLLKAGIRGVKEAYGNTKVPIMIHIDKGGDKGATEYFFKKITEYSVDFDIIGQSYYPWWHGSFADLECNLKWTSENYNKDIIIVETAYYSKDWYPKPGPGVLDIKPFPSTEEGQYDFLKALDSICHLYPKVKGIFYWEPEDIRIPESHVWYSGRSLFDEDGSAFKGITAFKK
jgi:arabinogalactan endo-1,4-beta-galactosidase